MSKMSCFWGGVGRESAGEVSCENSLLPAAALEMAVKEQNPMHSSRYW